MRNQGCNLVKFQPVAISQERKKPPPTQGSTNKPIGVVPLQLSGTRNLVVQELSRGYHHIQRYNAAVASVVEEVSVERSQRQDGGKRASQICCRCGRPRKGRFHDRAAARNSDAYCTVPEDQRVPGHVVPPGYQQHR
jgi:hypothetical protein